MSADNRHFVHPRLCDIHQTWWQLAAVQLTGFVSLPILAASVLILEQSNWLGAIITLIVGNALLWLFRLAIITMSSEGRKSIMDIACEYFGLVPSYFVAILLLVSALAWFVIETTVASNAIFKLIPVEEGTGINQFFQIGVSLGIVSTLLCMNGMVLLRKVTAVCIPILFIALIIIMMNAHFVISVPEAKGWSLSGLPLFLAMSLGLSADLPTFFRHSESLRSSVYALTAIQVVSLILGICGLFLGSIIVPWMGISETMDLGVDHFWLKAALVTLIFLSVVCTNLCSIYSASVGWELIAPVLAGIKEYLMIGLGFSVTFVLVANVFSLEFLETVTGCLLVNLTLVLVLAYFLQVRNHCSPNRTEQRFYFTAWLLASLVNIGQSCQLFGSTRSTLFVSVAIVFLVLGALLFWKNYLRQKLRRIGGRF